MNAMKIRFWSIALFVLALFGFIDSLYLTYSGPKFHFFEQLCVENVCSDADSLKLFGIHISIYGAFYYIFLMIFSFFFRYKKFLELPLLLSAVGLLFSFYFLYYQAFVIKGFCIFCLFSFICTTAYFIICSIMYIICQKHKKSSH
jgi:uncharacterized membrane protein